jgi:RHS repeat-associated protein
LNRNAKGVTRTMVYDVFGQLVADYLGSSGSTLERENIYRGGQLLAVYETGASCFKSISQFVTDFYQGVLHRQPNSTELTNATTTLTQAQSQGQGQLIVAAQSLGTTLFTSPEYLSLNPDIPANRGQFVTDLYAGYLGRVPDGYGYQAWLNALNTGSSREDVRHGFAYSAEFQNDVGQLCVTMTSSGINYVLQDLQGSTRAVMNNNGGCSTIVSRHDYLPFGEEIWSGTGMRSLSQGYGTTDRNRQKYGLTERDDATGLDHTWWRKYESFAGRWTSPDPALASMNVENPQSFNRYTYVGNDPVNFVDPTGLEWMCLVWGGWAGSWEIPLDCWEVNREPKSFGSSGGGAHPDGRGGGPGQQVGGGRAGDPARTPEQKKQDYKDCVKKAGAEFKQKHDAIPNVFHNSLPSARAVGGILLYTAVRTGGLAVAVGSISLSAAAPFVVSVSLISYAGVWLVNVASNTVSNAAQRGTLLGEFLKARNACKALLK